MIPDHPDSKRPAPDKRPQNRQDRQRQPFPAQRAESVIPEISGRQHQQKNAGQESGDARRGERGRLKQRQRAGGTQRPAHAPGNRNREEPSKPLFPIGAEKPCGNQNRQQEQNAANLQINRQIHTACSPVSCSHQNGTGKPCRIRGRRVLRPDGLQTLCATRPDLQSGSGSWAQ